MLSSRKQKPTVHAHAIATFCAIAVLLALSHGSSQGQTKNGEYSHKDVPKQLFQTSDRCFPCHNGLKTSKGEDISIGLEWRASIMANSSRDPYWQGSVRRETIDHPESKAAIEDECSKCHMPMARFDDAARGKKGTVFSHLPFDPDKIEDQLASDGVSCSLCHQVKADKLGTQESFVGGFVIDTAKPKGERNIYGPFDVENGLKRVMRTSSGGFQPNESLHIRQSELCATCHTLITEALGPDGKVVGSLPEQMPYQEWLASDFKNKQSCQSCHMPQVGEDVAIASVLGEPRNGFSRHVFVAANFFMQRMLNNYRGELSVAALPAELNAAADRTVNFLQTQSAHISITQLQSNGSELTANVNVENLSGHKFPTGYPSRRAWIHLVVRDRNDRIVFESGSLRPDGSIVGNDNDADAKKYEPHYREISDPNQVQIYESVLENSAGEITTGLLQAVRFVKDNRLLPHGFEKQSVSHEIAPQGDAASDPNFTGMGDTVRYVVNLGNAPGPFRVEAELWYQPTAYRWAHNLGAYDAHEPKRFLGYYEAMSTGSGIVVTHAAASSQ